jgi:hypothetical protein
MGLIIVGILIIAIVILQVITSIVMKKDTEKQRSDNKNYSNKSAELSNYRYVKKPFLTQSEKSFFNKLSSISQQGLLLLPQIPLSSVVKKLDNSRFANELYRTIDFGVFDSDYNCLALIELNDKSHNNYNRQSRDEKVNIICKKANIPLITFYTDVNYSNDEIKEKILNVIQQEALC